MAAKDNETQHNITILKALNDAIDHGPWEDSIFLQAIRKRLVELRDKFKVDVHLADSDLEEHVPATVLGRIAKRRGLIEVFVLLYNADGNNISKWEGLLAGIIRQIINRPVYRHEKDAKAALRAANLKQNEGYASVFIHEEDIIEPDPHRRAFDRYGNEILQLRDGAIQKENVHRFVHKTGNYEFENNKLIWQSSVEFL